MRSLPAELEELHPMLHPRYGTHHRYSLASRIPHIPHLTCAILLAMAGLTIVLTIPYYWLDKKGSRGGSGGLLPISCGQVPSQGNKQHSIYSSKTHLHDLSSTSSSLRVPLIQ
jgi:hypothetical protein